MYFKALKLSLKPPNNYARDNPQNIVLNNHQMGQDIPEWTKWNLWKTAFTYITDILEYLDPNILSNLA